MNTDELWPTTALIYVDNGQYYTVSRRTPEKEVWPKLHKLIIKNMEDKHPQFQNKVLIIPIFLTTQFVRIIYFKTLLLFYKPFTLLNFRYSA